MSNRIHCLEILLAGVVTVLAMGAPARSADDSETSTISFSKQILPIFEARCTECHSGAEPELGLVLASYRGTMAGSEYGPVVAPGDPDGSLLVNMIERGDMPDEGDPVPPEELALLRTWISQGASDN